MVECFGWLETQEGSEEVVTLTLHCQAVSKQTGFPIYKIKFLVLELVCLSWMCSVHVCDRCLSNPVVLSTGLCVACVNLPAISEVWWYSGHSTLLSVLASFKCLSLSLFPKFPDLVPWSMGLQFVRSWRPLHQCPNQRTRAHSRNSVHTCSC